MARYAIIAGLLSAVVASTCFGQGPTVSLPTTMSVSKPLSELATQPAPELAGPTTQPASEEDKKLVKGLIDSVDGTNPESVQKATDLLISKGETIIPAMKELQPNADEKGKKIIAAALDKLDWKLDVRKLITDWAVAKNKGFKASFTPAPLETEATAKMFPEIRFYLVAFPTHPVAMMPPEPLTSRQVFAVSKDGKKVQYIGDVDALKKFFTANLPAVKEVKDGKNAVAAWLQVGKEFASDGMYQFTISGDDIKNETKDSGQNATDAGLVFSGKAVVAAGGGPAGNKGFITATLTFDDKGKLKEAEQVANLRPGMRPLCQSTKLLDADPIVRKMARQDLLLMGSSAREYLAAQRAKSSPELQAAIDAIWREILDRENEDRVLDSKSK